MSHNCENERLRIDLGIVKQIEIGQEKRKIISCERKAIPEGENERGNIENF